jgi:hypothetical protein
MNKTGQGLRWHSLGKAAVVGGVLVSLAAPARAEIVGTDRLVSQTDRERVQDFLSRDDAEKQLNALGVAPETARQRVDAMTDEEVRVVAGKMDTLAAGGAFSTQEWLLIIIAILLLIVIL